MRRTIIAIAIVLASMGAAGSQPITEKELAANRALARQVFDPAYRERLTKSCMSTMNQLIGLSKQDLQMKCGFISPSSTTVTALGRVEQFIFTAGVSTMYVLTVNDKVTAVHR